MIHDYLEYQFSSLGRFDVLRISADSCGAQNKNNVVVSYIKSRVSDEMHRKIHVTFTAKGNTTFSVDGAGGGALQQSKHDIEP